MELRLTLLHPQSGYPPVDVAIDASTGTAFAAVSEQLTAALGVAPAPELQFRCAGAPVDGAQPLGVPPLLQGAVLTLASDRAPGRSDRPPAGLEAHVISGPDAGLVVPLTVGRHLIGRGRGHAVQLSDPEASRTHAELIVSDTRIGLRDVGSTRGTWLDDRRLGREPEDLPLEGRVRIGIGLIRVRRRDRPPAGLTQDGAGHLRINRGPQLRPGRPQVEIQFPARPQGRPANRLPWLTMLLPLLLAVPLAVLWKQPTFLLFAVLTPLLIAGQYVTDRRTGRRDAAERRARHAAVSTQRQHELEFATVADVAHLEAVRPDLARLAVTASTPTDELWRRSIGDAEFLALRLGRGPEVSPITVRRPASDDSAGADLTAQPFVHPEVPVAVDLMAARILGICGSRRSVLGLARSLIGQIAVLHSPREVRIQILTADPGHRSDWDWAGWLPHHESSWSTSTPELWTDNEQPHRIIVMDGAHTLRHAPEVADLLGRSARARAGAVTGPEPPMLLCLDRTERDLPMECGATVTLDHEHEHEHEHEHDQSAGSSPALLRRAGAAASPFVPDLAGQRWAERLARALAPLRDATPAPGQDLPDTVRLIDLLADADRVRPADPDDLARHWRRLDLRPSATLGLTASGPFRIDLRFDGPHLLIGGTTGAGKSQLLQTLVAALAVGSGPDEMSFLLIDYKGGSAFRECRELPHVAAVITDLDPAPARRALASLTAELRRRERLLRSAQQSDIVGYRDARADRPDLPAMPRLVVIVDEFRVLAEELPEFVSGLVRTATVGRSLGVHLVLATQRPAGAVSAEITANVSLRIALRVNDGGDSRDLIDDPAAAGLPADRPGRALARTGAGPLIRFQTAVVSGCLEDDAEPAPVVRRVDHDRDRHRAPRTGPSRSGPSDLVLIARAARAAVEQLELAPVHPPWMEPLPPNLPLGRLLELDSLDPGPLGRSFDPESPGPTSPPRTSPPRTSPPQKAPLQGSPVPESATGSPPMTPRRVARLPFALIDLPAEQRQEVLAWSLSGSHLAVSGGPRSGRSTALSTLGRVAGAVAGPEELHVYVLDGAGALQSLRDQPRVEAVIAVHDTERAERLLRLLASTIDARQGVDGSESLGPDIVLLIDGWEAVTADWGAVDHGRMIDQLIGVLRDGPAVGVHAAISGGRTLLTGAVSALLPQRVVLRFADPADALLAGVPSSRLLRSPPVGRGLVLGPGLPEAAETQIALGPLPATKVRSRHQVRPSAAQRSWQIPELPRRLDHPELISAWERQVIAGEASIDRRRPSVPVGIGGDEALVLGLELEAASITLVVGPNGSGRTNALRSIADGLVRLGEPVLWVSLSGRNNTSPGPGIPIVAGHRPDAASTLAVALADRPGSTIMVDDTQSTGSAGPVRDALEDRLAAHLGAGRLVVAGSAPELLGAYRGLLAVARTARSGLLLSPAGPGDAEVFGLRTERRPPGPPGRALLVQNGRAVTVQLARLPYAPDPGSTVSAARLVHPAVPPAPTVPPALAPALWTRTDPPPRSASPPARRSGEKVNT